LKEVYSSGLRFQISIALKVSVLLAALQCFQGPRTDFQALQPLSHPLRNHFTLATVSIFRPVLQFHTGRLLRNVSVDYYVLIISSRMAGAHAVANSRDAIDCTCRS
jgi:anthranilate phosphoribosyltransferase